MSAITVANIDRAFAVRGKSHLKLALRAAIQKALVAAPETAQDTHRRYYASALKAERGVRGTAIAIAAMFLVEALDAAPIPERDAVEAALDELL